MLYNLTANLRRRVRNSRNLFWYSPTCVISTTNSTKLWHMNPHRKWSDVCSAHINKTMDFYPMSRIPISELDTPYKPKLPNKYKQRHLGVREPKCFISWQKLLLEMKKLFRSSYHQIKHLLTPLLRELWDVDSKWEWLLYKNSLTKYSQTYNFFVFI